MELSAGSDTRRFNEIRMDLEEEDVAGTKNELHKKAKDLKSGFDRLHRCPVF